MTAADSYGGFVEPISDMSVVLHELAECITEAKK